MIYQYTHESRDPNEDHLVKIIVPWRRYDARGVGFNPRAVASFTKRANANARRARGAKV